MYGLPVQREVSQRRLLDSHVTLGWWRHWQHRWQMLHQKAARLYLQSVLPRMDGQQSFSRKRVQRYVLALHACALKEMYIFVNSFQSLVASASTRLMIFLSHVGDDCGHQGCLNPSCGENQVRHTACCAVLFILVAPMPFPDPSPN